MNRIVSAVASKGSQVRGGGVAIDLSRTSLTSADLGDIAARVRGTGARVHDVRIFDGG